jgi:hypothetical protein
MVMFGGKEKRQHQLGYKKNGDQWNAAHQFDIGHACKAYDRQFRPAPQRKQNAQREGEKDPDHGKQEGEQQSAPEVGAHDGHNPIFSVNPRVSRMKTGRDRIHPKITIGPAPRLAPPYSPANQLPGS